MVISSQSIFKTIIFIYIYQVYFYEALQCIPNDAIIVEVAPHSVLQAIVKRAMGANNTYVALMKKDLDGPEYMLSSLGEWVILWYNTYTFMPINNFFLDGNGICSNHFKYFKLNSIE